VTRRRGCLVAALAAALACAVGPSSASGYGFAGARTAAGPGSDVLSLGGVSLARDGGGSVAYLLRSGGQPHVYVSRLVRGDPKSRVRVDTGQVTGASDVRVAAADRGKIVVTWLSGGRVWGAVERRRGAGFDAPTTLCVCPTAAEPSLDVSRFGTAYLTFTTGGAGAHDVRVAVFDEGRWTLLSTPADIDPAHDAYGAHVAASSDATGVAAWVERAPGGQTRVFARRLLRGRLSRVPRQASLGSISGRTGLAADTPAVDVTDESSFVWVGFRQSFADHGATRSRVLAHRLRAEAFDRIAQIDGQRFPAKLGAVRPALALSGRGYGMALTTMTDGSLVASPLRRPRGSAELVFRHPVAVDGHNPEPPRAVVSIAESTHALAVWQRSHGADAVVARYFDGESFGDVHRLSPAPAGPPDGELGIDAEGDDADDDVVAFVQGAPGKRRIQVVAFAGQLEVSSVSGRRWRRTTRPSLSWEKVPTPVPWGPVRYRIEVDGHSVGTTRRTHLRPSRSLSEGLHVVGVVAIDGRGSETLRRSHVGVDTHRPSGRLRRVHGGDYKVWASDATSGLRDVRLELGDGSSIDVAVPPGGELNGKRVHVPSGAGSARLVIHDYAGWARVVE
jgi:hypothetical protein